jgi:hypothetical protein
MLRKLQISVGHVRPTTRAPSEIGGQSADNARNGTHNSFPGQDQSMPAWTEVERGRRRQGHDCCPGDDEHGVDHA